MRCRCFRQPCHAYSGSAKYDAVPIFVTREGQWLLSRFEDGALAKPASGTELGLAPGGHGRMLAIPAKGAPHDLPAIEYGVAVLHACMARTARWLVRVGRS